MWGFMRRLFPYWSAKQVGSSQVPSVGIRRVQHSLRIEYDDWGYAEFVHQSHLAAVEREMLAISAIGQGHDSAYGWTDIHLRDEIKEPLLPAEISLKTLQDIFPRRTNFKGVCFWGGGDEPAEQCFAFSTEGGLVIYGQHGPQNGADQLQSICFHSCETGDKVALSEELQALAQFAASQKLYLICWNKEFCSQPDENRYLRFFEQYK